MNHYWTAENPEAVSFGKLTTEQVTAMLTSGTNGEGVVQGEPPRSPAT